MKTQINSLKDLFVLIAKGFVVGIAMLIPGISGGTLALTMGIYEDLIESVTGVKKHFKQSLFFLLPLVIGALIGYIALVNIVALGLRYIPIPTITLFVGFIIGSLPSLYKNIEGQPRTSKNVLCFIIAMLFASSIGVLSHHLQLGVDASSLTTGSYFLIGIGGILSAFALVVPGISGSAIMLALGLYEVVIVKAIPSVLKFNFDSNLLIVVIFAVGSLVGLLLVTNLMKFLLSKHKTITFFAILGFIIGSIFSVYYNHDIFANNYYGILLENPLQFILLFVFLVVGIILALLVSRISSKETK